MSAPSLARTRAAIEALAPDAATGPESAWTLAQSLDHCASAIERSIDRYPVMRPAIFRATIGRLVLWRFLSRGSMTHQRGEQVPGLPDPDPSLDLATARARLLAAIDAFEAYRGPLAEHFVYGRVTYTEYAQLHAMHVEDHLRALR